MPSTAAGDEASSLIRQTQSSCVWARIDSTWRSKRSRGGSCVAMQIATDPGSGARSGAACRPGLPELYPAGASSSRTSRTAPSRPEAVRPDARRACSSTQATRGSAIAGIETIDHQ